MAELKKHIDYFYTDDVWAYISSIQKLINNTSIVKNVFDKNNINTICYLKEVAYYYNKYKLESGAKFLETKTLDAIILSVLIADSVWDLNNKQFRITHINTSGKLEFKISKSGEKIITDRINKFNNDTI